MRRLLRMLSFFVLTLALFQAVGARMPGVIAACVEVGHTDEPESCPVTCDCACRPPHRIPLYAPVELPVPPGEPASFATATFAPPPEPAPRPLLHVPIALHG